MNRIRFSHFVTLLLLLFAARVLAIEPIPRRVPPVGIEIPDDVRAATIARLADLNAKFKVIEGHAASADAAILLKATRLALTHGEIYRPQHLALLEETLALAEQRIEGLRSGRLTWQNDRLTVRGFYSRIDGSPQPYGLVLPDDLPVEKPAALYVWLHGRGDKTTDLHFIKQRLANVGTISPPGAIVLHPFGRQCLGFKSAGETDVLEAIEQVKANYRVDPKAVVLMGFSMGGAGAWHLGAHYADEFIAISPGAGFAETAKYQQLSARQVSDTPSYERQLWCVYDVPNYVRNLFNSPVVCYSGENDKQMQAARVMEAAFRAHGKKLDHVIGPGMGHQYHPDALAEIMSKMDIIVASPPTTTRQVHLQTRTLRYSRMHWIQVDQLKQHWNDSTVDAVVNNDVIEIATKNIAQLTISPLPKGARRIIIDGDELPIGEAMSVVLSHASTWQPGPLQTAHELVKKHGLQGPIDDAFLDRFMVVTPSTKSHNLQLDAWVAFELDHWRGRWEALFRAKLPEKMDTDVSEDDIRTANLIVFGNAESNSVLKRAMDQLPMQWSGESLSLGQVRHTGANYVPVMIYPNPLNAEKYIVVNSGPTFREAHDRTNSLQNPKLPDWAILDISTPPDSKRAGSVVEADFFDEYWRP